MRGQIAWAAWLPIFAALVLINYDRYGLDVDESSSRWYASMPLAAMFAHLRGVDGVFALYYSVLHIWALGGHTAYYLRALSLIFAVAALPVVCRIAELLFGRVAAFWSAGVLCSSFLFVTYAENVRMYSMAFLFCALAALYAVRAMYTADRRAPSLFALWSIVAIFAHPVAVAWVAALLLGAIWFAPRPQELVERMQRPTAAILAFGMVPLAFVTRLNGVGQIAWIGPLTAGKLADSLSYVSGGSSPLAALLIAALILLGVQRVNGPARSKFVLPVFWLLCSIAIVIGISFQIDVIQPYYFQYVWIAVSVACAGALAALRDPLRLAGGAAVAALLALNAYLLASNSWRHEDWRAAAALVHEHLAASDAIIVYVGRSIRPLCYALQELGDGADIAHVVYPRTGVNYGGQPPPATLADTLARRSVNVWLVLSDDTRHHSPAIERLLRRYAHTQFVTFKRVRVAYLSEPTPHFSAIPEARGADSSVRSARGLAMRRRDTSTPSPFPRL